METNWLAFTFYKGDRFQFNHRQAFLMKVFYWILFNEILIWVGITYPKLHTCINDNRNEADENGDSRLVDFKSIVVNNYLQQGLPTRFRVIPAVCNFIKDSVQYANKSESEILRRIMSILTTNPARNNMVPACPHFELCRHVCVWERGGL